MATVHHVEPGEFGFHRLSGLLIARAGPAAAQWSEHDGHPGHLSRPADEGDHRRAGGVAPSQEGLGSSLSGHPRNVILFFDQYLW
jgi:hypothetical protein